MIEPSVGLFEKVFTPLKKFTEYQLEKANFESLCREAYNKLSALAQVRTINEFDKSVSLYDFYVPPTVTSIENKNYKFTVQSLEDFASPKKVLISGIVGQGKSILMKKLALEESFKGDKFPIFIELRDLEERESLESYIHKNMTISLGIEGHKLLSYLLKEGKVTLFFDGFDEIKIEEMGRVVREFEKLEKKFSNLSFIVSSRPEETIEKSTIFSKYIINKLDLNGQINIIEKLTDQECIKENLIDNLKKSEKDIQGVLVTPLMVNFYYYLYKTEQIKGNNIILFYNQLFDLTLRKHDGTKLIYERKFVTGLKANELQSVFECICFISCSQKTFFFTEYDFIDIVNKAIKFNSLKCSTNDLIRDLTTGICFICREGQSYAYLHTSIPEFFGAKFIINNIGKKGLIDKLIQNFDDYINLIDYFKLIDERQFFLFFLKPILDNAIDFFKSKKVLDQIYLSTKEYEKNNYKKSFIKIMTVLDPEVHGFLGYNFREFIKPSMTEFIQKKFIGVKRIKYEFFWNSSSEFFDNKDAVVQSEHYFLHEKMDESSLTTEETTSRASLQYKIKKEEFKSITENYSQRAQPIEKALNYYNLKLDSWISKINEYENSAIDDLF